jgi:prepilin-type N-terminal cleavage/methylation domain-containing protein/prepilin-type processing-associated H-X9-DG protein
MRYDLTCVNKTRVAITAKPGYIYYTLEISLLHIYSERSVIYTGRLTDPLMNYPSFGHRRGFTLIEVLVTVMIIALLALLLLPFLKSSNDRARALKCANQLRTLSSAVFLYQADNTGFLPPNNAHSGGSYSDIWLMALRPYLSIQLTDTTGAGMIAMRTCVTCPSATGSDIPKLWWESNYAIGLAFGTDGTRKKMKFDNTAQTMMFIDSGSRTRSIYTTPPPTSNLGYRHDSRVNVIFFDGHLEKRLQSEIPTASSDIFWGL